MNYIEWVQCVYYSHYIHSQIEVKERRRDILKRQTPVLGPAPSPEPMMDSTESLTSEIKVRLKLLS